MADSSEIDNALVAKLGGDATLLALMPNGVYIEEAPPGMTRFVIVSLVTAIDEPIFGGDGFEDGLYLVDPRALSTSGGDVKAAAARIKTLLHLQPLTVAGYTSMIVHKDGRPGGRVEVDQVDASIRWNKRPAYYRVQMAPV